jgi:hypothetical protein
MVIQNEHGLAKALGDLLVPLHVVRWEADVRKDDLMAD